MSTMPTLFYFRLIFGFAGIIVIIVGSIFLMQDMYENRFFELELATLAFFVFNISIVCLVAWKICQKYSLKYHQKQ